MGLQQVRIHWLQRSVQTAHRSFYKASDLIRAAEQSAPTLPFGRDLFWLEHVLSEPSAGTALTFFCVAPACFSCECIFMKAKIERELLAAFSKQYGVHQRTSDCVAILRQRHRNTCGFADALSLSNDDFEDRTIDRAIRRVKENRPDES